MASNTDPREKLTSDLRKWVAEYDALTSKASNLRSKIYSHVYDWVTYAVENGHAKDVKAGCIRLGSTLKRSYSNVESWFYCGKFMREEKLDPDQADARSVRHVWNRRKSLAESEKHKALSMIRKGAPYEKIAYLVDKSTTAAGRAATVKAAKLEKKGQLDKQRVKMEMMAVHTLLERLFKQPVALVALDSSSGKTLMQVGAKEPVLA